MKRPMIAMSLIDALGFYKRKGSPLHRTTFTINPGKTRRSLQVRQGILSSPQPSIRCDNTPTTHSRANIKTALIIILLAVLPALASAGNLIFMDRFNGDLSAWTKTDTGGTVSIVTRDNSPKMQLSDTSGSGHVSATTSYTEPGELYLVEFDLKTVANGDLVKAHLLSFEDDVIVELDLGSTKDTAYFRTDKTPASSVSWKHNVYKQVVFVVDVTRHTITCYISGDDGTYDSMNIVGSAKSYSGSSIAKLRFLTSSATQATAYIDDVRVYVPQIVIVGDSIADGKPLWSTHPAYSQRWVSSADGTSSPSYQLSQKLEVTTGVPTKTWVGNRAFGGSRLRDANARSNWDIYGKLRMIINQGFKSVILSAGHNDITYGDTLQTLKSDLNGIIGILQHAGIKPNNIVLCTVAPSISINTTSRRNVMDSYNRWIATKAADLGAHFADVYTALKSDTDPYMLKARYSKDGTHLTKIGSEAMAQTIYAAWLLNAPRAEMVKNYRTTSTERNCDCIGC